MTGDMEFPPAVLRAGRIPAAQRGSGASTVPLVTRAIGAEVFLNGITTFEAGGSIPLHLHNCAECVVILAGEAIAEIDGTEHRLGQYDTTYVAGGVPHRFRNASDREPMRILWTYASIDATRTIIGSGLTTRIDAEHQAATI
jgi:quercetin dioxygenase-like cupin family protein